MKRFLLPLFVVLCLCFLACGNKKADSGSQAEIEGGLEPIEFTIFHPDFNRKIPPDDALIVQQVYQKTGVMFRWTVPAADPLERLNIMLATDNLPDLISFNNPTVMQQFINAGKLLPLDDLMIEHAPQAYNVNYANFRDRIRNPVDDKLYFLPSEYTMGNEDSKALPETDTTFVMRTGLLEELGWYNPKDFDAVFRLLEISRERQPGMVPLALALGPQGHLETLNVIGAGAYGLLYEDSNIILDGNAVKYFTEIPQMKEWYAFLNRIRRAGLLDPESPVLSADLLKEKVVAGKVFSWFGPGWEIGSEFISYMESLGSDEQCLWYLFPRANDSITRTTYARYVEGLYSTGLTLTKNCKDPVRFMQFYEYLNTEEGWFASEGIVNWDFQGENTVEATEGYDFVVMNGKPEVIPGKKPATITEWMGHKWNDDENWWWNRGLESFYDFKYYGNHPLGKYDIMEHDVGMWWDENTTRIYGAYGITGTNYFDIQAATGADITRISGLIIDPDSEEAVIQLNMQEYLKTQLPRVIMAETESQFENLWREMVNRLNQDGKEKFVAKKNELFKQRLEDWGLN